MRGLRPRILIERNEKQSNKRSESRKPKPIDWSSSPRSGTLHVLPREPLAICVWDVPSLKAEEAKRKFEAELKQQQEKEVSVSSVMCRKEDVQ